MADSEFVLTLHGEKELLKKIEALPTKIRERVGRTALSKAALLLENHIKRDKLSGTVLHVRSGRLRGSITHEVSRVGDDLIARIGTKLVYARIHEFGGIIRAKNHPYLVFPIRGVQTTGARGQLLKRPRHTIETWVRVKQVTIPKRPYMVPALKGKRQEIIQTIAEEVGKAVTAP